MKIGEAIREIRKEKGLSQQELANLSNISQTYLSQLEVGDRFRPTLDILLKISKALEVPLPILTFLTLDDSDITKSKLATYKKIEPKLDALIKEFLLAENKEGK